MPNPYTASGTLRTVQTPAAGPGLFDAAAGLLAADRLKGAGQALKSRMALSPAAMQNLRGLATRGVPLGAGILGILAAVEELEDTDPGETRGKNVADAAGRAIGSTGGAILGGVLGAPLGPLGVAGGSILGSTLLGNAGRSVTGGLYNLVSSPEERVAYQEQLKNKRGLANLRELAGLQLALERRRADDAAARDLEANYRNTLNQMMVNEQVLDAQQQAAMMAMIGR